MVSSVVAGNKDDVALFLGHTWWKERTDSRKTSMHWIRSVPPTVLGRHYWLTACVMKASALPGPAG